MYIYIYIQKYSSMKIKPILSLSCLYILPILPFPIPNTICLLLPPRPPPCMQLSVFPHFPAVKLTFLAVSAAVISYGNIIDTQNVIVLNSS